MAKSKADEKIIEAKQNLEVFRQDSNSQIEKGSLEADNAILEAEARGERKVQELTVQLNKLKNVSDVVLEEEAKQKAAEILARQPQAIQLRYLETLTEIAGDKTHTLVFPLPMDLVEPLLNLKKTDQG